MKQEKREITLNEEDSLLDMLYVEYGLAESYLQGCMRATSKQEGEILKENLCMVIEDAKKLMTILQDKYPKKKV